MERDFGKCFKDCRLQCKMTQKDVAERLGIHQSNISDWENNISRPEYENLIKLSEIYDVSLYDLLGLKENE